MILETQPIKANTAEYYKFTRDRLKDDISDCKFELESIQKQIESKSLELKEIVESMQTVQEQDRYIYQTNLIDLTLLAAADVFDITVETLTSKTRKRPVVMARNYCFKSLRDNTKLPLYGIAKVLGLTNHATVLHGIKSHELDCLFNPAYNNKCNAADAIIKTHNRW